MAAVFKIGLVEKNEFTDYLSARQSMNIPWFRMMFSRNYLRKILRTFHIADKTIIPAKDDPSYRPSLTLRLQLDYMNCLLFVSLVQTVAINQSNP